jgi:hypothetical protein
LNRPQPQVEITVTAKLTDPDNPANDMGEDGITGRTWQWSKSTDMQEWTDIEGETSPSYTPAVADIGSYLRATAVYDDTLGEDKTATSMASEMAVEPETSANAIPGFGKVDADADATPEVLLEDGSANAPFLRSVDENTVAAMSIGNPIMATDDDEDLLVYEVVNRLDAQGTTDDTPEATADREAFSIDDRSGQIKTKGDLDFEDAANEDDAYTVGVKATDPSQAAKTVNVLITVKDLNEAPDFGKRQLHSRWKKARSSWIPMLGTRTSMPPTLTLGIMKTLPMKRAVLTRGHSTSALPAPSHS